MSAKGVLFEFQEFLLAHKLAQEKHVLFLAVWVSNFLAFSNRKGHQDLGLTVAEFLKSLEAKEDIMDWQLRQAGEAVPSGCAYEGKALKACPASLTGYRRLLPH